MLEPNLRRSRAEELFADCLTRRGSGDKVDFEALCVAHPELSAESRAFHTALELI